MKETVKCYLRAFRRLHELEPKLLPLSVVLALAGGIQPFVNIWFSAAIIAELSGEKRVEELVLLVACALLLNLVLLIAKGCMDEAYYHLRSRAYNRERIAVERKLFQMDYAKLEDGDFQQLVHLHSESCERVFSAFVQLSWMFRDFLTGLVMLVCSFTTLGPLFKIGLTKTGEGFAHSPWFFLSLFGAILVAVVVILVVSARTSKMWFQTQEAYNKLDRLFAAYNDILADYRSGKEVRLYNERPLIEKEAADSLLTKGEKILSAFANKSAVSSSYIAIVGALVGLGVYLFIGVKGLLGLFSVDALVRYAGSFIQVVNGISSIAATLGKSSELRPNLEYYFKIIDTPDTMTYGTREVDLQNIRIEFKHVYFRYPSADADTLKDISLKVDAGSRLAVVGRNGSGKTTFIKLLCRLYDVKSGEILINGVNIKELTRACCEKLFAVVFQDFKLFALALDENVTCGAEPDNEQLEKVLREADIYDRVLSMPEREKTYLYKDIRKEGVEISGGEAQKLVLARALYKDAPVVILDEPTAALDPVAENHVYNEFNNFVEGKTAIYISHRLSSCRFCDRIAVFKNGQLCEYGTHDALLEQAGEYSRLWNAQAKYYAQ